jgi:hypothetical protein
MRNTFKPNTFTPMKEFGKRKKKKKNEKKPIKNEEKSGTQKQNHLSRDAMVKVKCYFNLHKQVFSVKQERCPVQHFDWVLLRDCSFRVYQSGRKRVLESKQKNVHAFVIGEMVGNNKNSSLDDKILKEIVKENRIRYNPYLHDYFFRDIDNSRIDKSNSILLINKQVFESPNILM